MTEDKSKTFQVGSLHSEADIANETKAMLGDGDITLTLGLLMRLHLAKSPYITGGQITDSDLDIARAIVPSRRLGPLEFHEALLKELATAWRAYGIISPSQELPTPRGRQSQVDLFSPEWLADTINMACAAMPSLTYRQILWEVPLTMVLHLAISTARRNGTITERPADIMAALKKMKELQQNG